MSNEEFLVKLKENTNYELKDELKDSYIVFNSETGKKYKISKSSLNDTDWNNLSSVLNGRDAFVVDGITRIVGYFSKVSNWNKSKIGELKDRQKGNYCIK